MPASIMAAVTASSASDLRGGWKVLGWLVPVAFFVTLLDFLVGLNARSRLVGRCKRPGVDDAAAWSSRRSIGMMTLVVGLVAVPVAVLFGGTHYPLLEAKVCTSAGEQVGILIGETSDRTYLGEKHKPSRPLLVYSIPQSEITQTIIGGHAGTRDCPGPAT